MKTWAKMPNRKTKADKVQWKDNVRLAVKNGINATGTTVYVRFAMARYRYLSTFGGDAKWTHTKTRLIDEFRDWARTNHCTRLKEDAVERKLAAKKKKAEFDALSLHERERVKAEQKKRADQKKRDDATQRYLERKSIPKRSEVRVISYTIADAEKMEELRTLHEVNIVAMLEFLDWMTRRGAFYASDFEEEASRAHPREWYEPIGKYFDRIRPYVEDRIKTILYQEQEKNN